MNNPFPGVKVTIFNETEISYLNASGNIVDVRDQQRVVSNYRDELDENDSYRKILLLKPEYLGVFISDMKNIMSYAPSSETIDNKTKKVYNPKLTGV